MTREQIDRYINVDPDNLSDIEDDDIDVEDDDNTDDYVVTFSHPNRNQTTTTTNTVTTNTATLRRSYVPTLRNNSFSTSHRRSSYPRTFPGIIINTYENYSTNGNPFTPSSELPRTPVNNTSNTNNTNNTNRGNFSSNTISNRFNLGFR